MILGKLEGGVVSILSNALHNNLPTLHKTLWAVLADVHKTLCAVLADTTQQLADATQDSLGGLLTLCLRTLFTVC